MSSFFGPRRITQAYLRRYGTDTKRARAWAGRKVQIRTENGVWRDGGCGYTTADSPAAWILPFEEAVRTISHCGPEKKGTFLLAPAEPDISLS